MNNFSGRWLHRVGLDCLYFYMVNVGLFKLTARSVGWKDPNIDKQISHSKYIMSNVKTTKPRHWEKNVANRAFCMWNNFPSKNNPLFAYSFRANLFTHIHRWNHRHFQLWCCVYIIINVDVIKLRPVPVWLSYAKTWA